MLAEDYKEHFASPPKHDGVIDADFSTSQSVKSIVEQLLSNKEKQWRVSLLAKEVKIREQAERLSKFLLWSDPIINHALSTQPYTALAWSGITSLLPVRK